MQKNVSKIKIEMQKIMNSTLNQIKTDVYDNCSLEISDFENELESKEYYACRFKLNGFTIICRSAKITPKKIGQFVTFWKRKENEPIAPFDENDQFDFYVVNVRKGNKFGQFVFPKNELIDKGILSTDKKEGKRAFRVYPDWDIAKNKTAEQTQKWQKDYFYKIDNSIDFEKVRKLYKMNDSAKSASHK